MNAKEEEDGSEGKGERAAALAANDDLYPSSLYPPASTRGVDDAPNADAQEEGLRKRRANFKKQSIEIPSNAKPQDGITCVGVGAGNDGDISAVPVFPAARQRNRVAAFLLGLYRVYVFDNFRGLFDLLTDGDQVQAMKDFFGLFVEHFGGTGRSVHMSLLGLIIVSAYGPTEQRHGSSTGQKVSPREHEELLLRTAYRTMQLSAAAYGWSMLNHMASMFNLQFLDVSKPKAHDVAKGREEGRGLNGSRTPSSRGGESPALSPGMMNSDEIEENLSGVTTITSMVDGICADDVIYANFTSTMKTAGKLPNHYVLIDHEENAIVVSFRGTLSLSEAITDVNCAPEPVVVCGEEGFVHVAMMKGAEMAMLELEELLLAVAEFYPEYRMRTVGHSLGAGVAVLLAVRMKEKHPELPIESWVFGCPGILSLNLARKIETCFADYERDLKFDPPIQFIQAFTVGDDNVPRLSHGSILDLTLMADQLWTCFKGKRQGVVAAIRFAWDNMPRTPIGWLYYVSDLALMLSAMVIIAAFGYAAKCAHTMGQISTLTRRYIPSCPESLRGANKILEESMREASHIYASFESEDEGVGAGGYGYVGRESGGEGDGEGNALSQRGQHVSIGHVHFEEEAHDDSSMDCLSPRMKRLPTLFREISADTANASKLQSLSFNSFSRRSISNWMSDDEDERAAGGGGGGGDEGRLTTFASVVNETISRKERDENVRKAAKKFLMFAQNDKLYPPAQVYQIQVGTLSPNPLNLYDLEKSRPEYFGWLLFSARMLLHHTPRAYLVALRALQRKVSIGRKRAQARWRMISRKSKMASILGMFVPASVSLATVSALEKASDSFTQWVSEIEHIGAHEDIHAPCESDVKSALRCVKNQFSAKKAWKLAGIRAKSAAFAVNRLTGQEQRLQKALRDISAKEIEVVETLNSPIGSPRFRS